MIIVLCSGQVISVSEATLFDDDEQWLICYASRRRYLAQFKLSEVAAFWYDNTEVDIKSK